MFIKNGVLASFFVLSHVLCLISITPHPLLLFFYPFVFGAVIVHNAKGQPSKEQGGGHMGTWQCCRRELSAMDLLVLLALVSPEESNPWMEDKMFTMNEQLIGCMTIATLMKRG
jgi:hypothetical protein